MMPAASSSAQRPNSCYHFTGKERDAETGLDYSGAQGRFTSPDSTSYSKMGNPQSWNLYAYSFNNSPIFIDPTGHEVDLVFNHLLMIKPLNNT
jgi:RHS repeat-associated protein